MGKPLVPGHANPSLDPDGGLRVGGVLRDVRSLVFESTVEHTIAGGAITMGIGEGHIRIDTEGGAANDDLDTINGGESGEIIFVLPQADARTVRIRNGVGNIFTKHQIDGRDYGFTSPSGSSGIFYNGGYYFFPTADANLTQSGTSVILGSANVAYAGHAAIVAGGAGAVDTGVIKLTATGTKMDDEGNRATSTKVTMVADITTLSTNDYVETSEKFIGQVVFALETASGSPVNFSLNFNYGLAKYEDFGNQDFTITFLESVGLAGAADTGFNIKLYHHKASGWTYAATGFTPGGTVLANMNTDHNTETNLANGEPFAYKRTNLNTDILGNNAEGVVIEITTGANKAVESMDTHIAVHTAPLYTYMATTKQHLIFMKHGPNWLEL